MGITRVITYTTQNRRVSFTNWPDDLDPRSQSVIIVLLIGGSKGTQSRDIEKAKRYWNNYQGSVDD